MNCGACRHWDLSHALGKLGFGRCKVQTNQMLRDRHTTSAQCICRIGRFVPIKPEPKA